MTSRFLTAASVLALVSACSSQPGPSSLSPIQLANQALQAGNYSVAEQAYQGVLANTPNNPTAMLGLAQVYEATQRSNEAVDLYRKVSAAQSGAIRVFGDGSGRQDGVTELATRRLGQLGHGDMSGFEAPQPALPVAAPIAEASAPDLDGLFPDQFGDWSRVDFGEAILPAESTIGPGEAVAYRAWRNSLGRIVTLVVAYGPPASDSVRLHRPETCYTGQGFLVEWRERGAVSLGDQFIPVNRLMTRNAVRSEAVSYWLRAGDNYAVTAAAHQWINLQQGLGRTADGVLVRMSTSGGDDREFDLHVEFIENLLAAMTPQDRKLLIASGDSLQS